MTILSNIAIARALKSRDLVITPSPAGEPGDGEWGDTCSVHLHLGKTVHVPKKGVQIAFDLARPGSIKETLRTYFEERQIPEGGWPLEPGDYVIATTREKVGFPCDNGNNQLAGRIEGRSRFARVGLLVHFTAPTLHADWTGPVSLELKNLGTQSIILRHGSAICQLIVETVEGELAKAPGEFDLQTSATG